MENMRYKNYEEIGKKVIEYALDKDKWPGGGEGPIELLTADLGANIGIPLRFKRFKFFQGDDELLILNLPAKHELEDLIDKINAELKKPDADTVGSYGIPDFYPLDPDPNATFKAGGRIGFFRSRIAEYTIRGCR